MPINEEAIDRLLSWEGEVGRAFLDRIEKYEEVVRVHAPIRPDSPGPHLADSIGHELVPMAGRDLQALVGVNPEVLDRGYAEPVTAGARPHVIAARQPGKLLRFRIAGKIVFARQVNHPGNEPNRFLTDHLGEITR